MKDTTSWCVLIPCLNEAAGIAAVIESVLARHPQVIVVDDGSEDDTAAIVAAYPVTLLRHDRRRGKGQALRSGFAEALRQGHAGVLTMDGDGQHLAADIPRIRAASLAHPHSLVIGARLRQRSRQPRLRRWANQLADWGVSWVCARGVLDTQSGQRWYPRAALQLPLSDVQDFAFETSILIDACRALDMNVVAVPISSRYEQHFRPSHFRPLQDALTIGTTSARLLCRHGKILSSYRQSRRRRPVLWCDHQDR